MGVDGGVSECPDEGFALFELAVLPCLRVSESFSESIIDEVDVISFLVRADKEVIRLDVSVDEVLRVHVLDARDDLLSKHQHCLYRELPRTHHEEVFQRMSE